jgi:LysM repeat protein
MEKYKVKAGDSLAKIGQRFSVTLADMIKANPTLKNPDLIFPGQMINVPVLARHPKEEPAATGTTTGDVFASALNTTGEPRKDPKYIENAVVAVGLPIWGGPFYLYRNVVNGRGTEAVVLDRKDVALANDPLKSSFFELRMVFASRQEAEQAATKAGAEYKVSGPYAYYKTIDGLIYPTILSDSTAPALCKALRQAVANEQADAKAAEKLAKELLLWYVGARLPLKTGEPSAAKATTAAADAALAGFNAAEKAIIIEVRAMLKAPELAQIRAAHAAGKEVVVKIGGRLIQYEPAMNASGMTMFGENGFLIGRQAFTSEAEFVKTLLHETHRLVTSAIGRGAGASGAAVAAETEAAFTFAERAYRAVLAGL